jgi:hypothetical protein
VTNHLRAARIIPGDTTALSDATLFQINDSDEAILRALEEFPFSSVGQLSCAAHLPKTTVYRRLSEKLGLTARHLRWVPHRLSEAQKARRVQCSQSLLTRLRDQQTRAWHDIVTLDESWFYYITGHELIRLPPDGKVRDREPVTIQSKKVMLTIVCGPTGFAVVLALEGGCNSTRAII